MVDSRYVGTGEKSLENVSILRLIQPQVMVDQLRDRTLSHNKLQILQRYSCLISNKLYFACGPRPTSFET